MMRFAYFMKIEFLQQGTDLVTEKFFLPAADVIRIVSRTGLTTNNTVGRLELFINGEWGTVCLDNFGATLDVACCQLGFSGGAVAAHDQQNLR